MNWRRGIGLFFAIIALSLGWLLGSTGGLQFAVKTALGFAPMPIEVGHVEGRLWNKLRLFGVRVQIPGRDIAVDDIALSWHLPRLLGGVVVIKDFDVDGIRVTPNTIAPDKTKESPPASEITLPSVELPVTIRIDNATVRNISVSTQDPNAPIEIANVALKADFNNRTGLTLHNLSVAMDAGGVRVFGRVIPVGAYPLELVAQWHWHTQQLPELAGGLKISGSMTNLVVAHMLHAPTSVELNATLREPLNALQWKGDIRLAETDPSSVNPNWPAGAVAASVSGEGTLESATALGKVSVALAEIQSESKFDVRYANQQIDLRHIRAQINPGNAVVEVKGNVALAADAPQANLSGTWRSLRWPLTGEKQVASPSGQWSFSGNQNQFSASIDGLLETFGVAVRELTIAARADGTPQRINVSSLEAKSDTDTLAMNGTVALESIPTFDVTGKWSQLTLPVTPAIFIRAGEFSLKGHADDYKLTLATHIAGDNLPPSRLQLRATGNQKRAEFDQIRLDALDGTIGGDAQVQWAPALNWNAHLEAKNLKPQSLEPTLPGIINFNLATDGSKTDTLSANLRVTDLAGTLREQPITGLVDVAWNDGDLEIKPLLLRFGSSQVIAGGHLLKQWSLSWNAQLPDIDEFGLDARGSILSAGNFSNERNGPQMAAQIDATDLQYGAHRIGSLDLDARTILDADVLSYITLNADNIITAGQEISQVRLTGHGNPSDHFVAARISRQKLDATVHAQGSFANNQWDGNILTSNFTVPRSGQWNQRAAAKLHVAADAYSLEPTCWAHTNSELCVKGNFHPQRPWAVQTYSDTLSLSLLDPWLPGSVATSGVFTLIGNVRGDGPTIADADVRLGSPEGKLDFELNETETITVNYRDARFDALWRDNKLALLGSVDLNEKDNVRARFDITDLDSHSVLEAPANGDVSFTLSRLNVIPAIVPSIDTVNGVLGGKFTVDGSLDNPTLGGNARINDGVVYISQLGITLHDITLKLNSSNTDSAIDYAVGVRSGEGKLSTTGRFDWTFKKHNVTNTSASDLQTSEPAPTTFDWSNTTLVTGDNFEVLNSPEYQVWIAPEIAVTAVSGKVDILGTMGVPLAKLRPKELSGAVGRSSDIVFVDEKQETEKTLVSSIVRLSLGDKVDLEGFGLKAKFAGDIVVMDSPNQATSAHGEIRVTQGEYKMFGQKLDIERGRLVFIGGVIDDPGLDIRANREIGDVVAGANIRGTLREPTISVYSVPPMAESDALAYLIAGRPLRETTSDEGGSVYSAATSAGYAGGAILARRLGAALGFEEEQIELDSENLSVGRYLSPKLYVSYGRNLIEQVNTLRMRYTLSSRWSLEGESGKEQGADLLYTLETE